MNEFTNPAGSLGNNPFLQAPSTISPMKGKSSETGLAASISRPKSMIPVTRNRFDRYTAQQRMASADILNAHLLMVEIMMTNITQKYIYEVVSCLKERGLMRHNMKRRANELVNLSSDLMKRCNAHDAMQVRTFTETIHPGLSGSFIRGGGTLTQKLQNIFWKTYGEKINLIYFATKNALDKCNVRQSDIVSNMEMVAMMCTTGIEFYDCMCRKVDGLLNGVGKVNRQKSQHNEKMMAAVKDMLREMVGNIEIPDKEGTDVRTLTAQFQMELVKDDLLKLVESGIVSLQVEFIEYVIASLRMKMAGEGLSFQDYRTLMARMGTKNNVRMLLNEIALLPLPESEDYEVYDVMEMLPDAKAEGESVIDKFRRLCFEDHIRMVPETKEAITLRKLRQEVYRNHGTLSMLTLRYLYNVFGTKKAMSEYIARADSDVMYRTLRMLKTVKVSQLALKEGCRYELNLGIGVRTLYEMRGYTREKFASMAGVGTDRMLELEAIGDMASYPNAEKIVGPFVTDVGKLLGVDPRYVLFASLRETGENGTLPEVYKRLFREMEKVYNNNYNKSEENGKEEKKE
jgi:hypothetical protein